MKKLWLNKKSKAYFKSASADLQNKWFQEAKRDLLKMRARNPITGDINLIEQKHQQLEEKIHALEESIG